MNLIMNHPSVSASPYPFSNRSLILTDFSVSATWGPFRNLSWWDLGLEPERMADL